MKALLPGSVGVWCLICLLGTAQAGSAMSRQVGLPTGGGAYRHSAKVVIRLRDGTVAAGFLSDMAGDTVVLRSQRGETIVPVSDAVGVTVTPPSNRWSRVLFGAMGTAYVANLLAYRADGNPTAFYSEDTDDNAWGEIFANLIFAAGGSVLGVLSTVNREMRFVPAASDEEAAAALSFLRRLVKRQSARPRLNFTVSTGLVHTGTRDDAEEAFQNAQVDIFAASGFILKTDPEVSSRFNMLRRVGLTYTAQAWLETGAAVVWIGEPLIWGWKQGWTIQESYEGYGVFAIGKVSLWRDPQDEFSIHAGGGLGAASLDYVFRSQTYDWDQREYLNVDHCIKETSPALLLLAEMRWYLGRHHSFHLGWDWVIGKSYDMGGNPDIGIGPRKIRLGNSSITLSLGLHR